MDRLILHSDLNNFYASAEISRNRSLRGLPIAVAGDVEERHGIVLAKSYEAKRCGVKTGEALWQARAKCPDIRFIPPDFPFYAELSARVREIYLSYTDMVESFGVDECWLDVTGSHKLFAPSFLDPFNGACAIAEEIRRRVKRETGLTVSVGVSYNKTFAKLASDMRKPDAVTAIPRESFRETVWSLPIEELLFVGGKTAQKLKLYGIHTIGALATADESFVRLLLGKRGVELRRAARGEESSPVLRRREVPQAKSVGCGTTTRSDLVRDEDMRRVLYSLCENVSSRLREQKLMCRTVRLGIREYDLYTFERQTTLTEATRTAQAIFGAAYALLCANRRDDRPIRSLTVQASSIESEEGSQMTMFPHSEHERREELESCIDELRKKYGRGIMKWGNESPKSPRAPIFAPGAVRL